MLMLKHSHIVCMISVKKLTVYQYDGLILTESLSFNADDFGRAEFEIFLDNNKKGIYHFLLDLHDELFSNEATPNLSVLDQRDYGQRKLNQLLPRTPFRRLRWSRNKSDKQKMLLLAGLTKPDIVNFWYELFEEYSLRLGSISTVSLLAHALTRRMNFKAKRLVLAHTASGNSLRFTYLHNGHISLSRINLTEEENDTAVGILQRESNRLLNYLSSIRSLGFGERLTLLVLTDKMLSVEAIQNVQFNEQIDVEILSLDDVARLAKIPKKLDHTNDLFANLTAMAGFRNHYAPLEYRRFYMLLRIRQTLWIGAFCGILLTLGGFFVELGWQFEADQQYAQIERNITQTMQNTRLIRPQVRENEASPLDQRAVVKNIETIRYNWPTPVLALQITHEVLRSAPGLQLENLEWHIIHPEHFDNAEMPPSLPSIIIAENAENAAQNTPLSLEKPLPATIKATFRITRPDLPYRMMLNWIDVMTERLKRAGMIVTRVDPPVDLASDASFNTDANAPLPDSASFVMVWQIPAAEALTEEETPSGG